MKLFKQENQLLVPNLMVADSFWGKLQGLMGKDHLDSNSALWLKFAVTDCIHTFFMKFSIDVIFIDKDMKIRKIIANVAPWRMTRIVFNAKSVIEMPAGRAEQLGLKEGDQLYVVN